jgi:hypothetical protein
LAPPFFGALLIVCFERNTVAVTEIEFGRVVMQEGAIDGQQTLFAIFR